MENKKNKRTGNRVCSRRFRQRVSALLLAAALAVPAQVCAQEGETEGSLPKEKESFLQEAVPQPLKMAPS